MTNEDTKHKASTAAVDPVDVFVMHLATDAARYIFAIGDDPNSPCQRIEFKGGMRPNAEIPQGGLDESALAKYLAESIRKYLGYNSYYVECKAMRALEEIREIYAGMDGFIAQTAPEAYQARIIKQMYRIAVKDITA